MGKLSENILKKRKENLFKLNDDINEIVKSIKNFNNSFLIDKLSLNNNKLFIKSFKDLALKELPFHNIFGYDLIGFMRYFFTKINLSLDDASLCFEKVKNLSWNDVTSETGFLYNDHEVNLETSFLHLKKTDDNMSFIKKLIRILVNNQVNRKNIINKINSSLKKLNCNCVLDFKIFDKMFGSDQAVIIKFNFNKYLNIKYIVYQTKEYINYDLYFTFKSQKMNLEGVDFELTQDCVTMKL